MIYLISLNIFKNVFCNYLKNKTRILVISKKSFLPFVDKIIYLEKGKISFFGDYEKFKEFNKDIEDIKEKDENIKNKKMNLKKTKE